jgi:hypothetical protein
VLGYLAAAALSAVEGAVVVGGASAIGAALTSIRIPKNSVLQYETAIEADGFLVMAHGTPGEMARAKSILATANPTSLDDVRGEADTGLSHEQFAHAHG